MIVRHSKTIKSIIASFLPNAKILLFGSMARGNQDINSDYDILLITSEKYEEKEKKIWRNKIHRALVYAINAPFDIIINSEEEIIKKKELPGHFIKTALKEGVLL